MGFNGKYANITLRPKEHYLLTSYSGFNRAQLKKMSLFIFFLTLEHCFPLLPLLRLRPCPLRPFRTLCAESRTFLRTTSRNFALGSAMSVSMFCPVASASQPTVFAPCQSNGRPEPVQNTGDTITALKERRITVYWAYTVISVTAPRLM